ncbi:MAG: MFS transporter permease [Lyngbya sp. HA4199-MV5]|nr:MFS transporter permease [Lyngbya sp. HA4199-MV5]
MSSSAQSTPKVRQSSAKSLQAIGGLILIAGIIASIAGNSFLLFAISVFLGVGSIYLGTQQRRNSMFKHQAFTIEPTQFQGWLGRWQQFNGAPFQLLSPSREETTPATVNPDVTAYSFDRLVVCDTSTIAQLLIANNFHFENNCAILSITGYPSSIFDTTMTMLRRNPELKVYAFHDCTPRGIGLIHQLRTSTKWFQNSTVEIFDVGLLPRQIFLSKSMFVQNAPDAVQAAQQMPTEVRASLSNEELAWLEAGNCVELESFTPQQLIHILNHGIAGSRELGSNDGGLIFIDSYPGSSYYVVESFG